MEVGTLIALGAMVISLFGAVIKFIDRRRQIKKEQKELNKQQAISQVERDSFVIRGAEGALLMMEKTLKTANEECEKHIKELEEENADLRCDIANLKVEMKELRGELNEVNIELRRMTNG